MTPFVPYGRPGASDEQVRAAARKAQAHEFILGLQDWKGRSGYDTHVGERGVKLSGGRHQRVATETAIEPPEEPTPEEMRVEPMPERGKDDAPVVTRA